VGHNRSGRLRWEIVGGHTEVVAHGFMDRDGVQWAMAMLDEQEDQALAARGVAATAMRRVELGPVVRPRAEGCAYGDLSLR